MTDFTRFLNSKDVAEYLRSTGYEFTPEEAAYVVHEARNVPLVKMSSSFAKKG